MKDDREVLAAQLPNEWSNDILGCDLVSWETGEASGYLKPLFGKPLVHEGFRRAPSTV